MKKLRIILFLLGLAMLPLTAPAVIIAMGDGTGNTNAPPTGDQGWSYVGRISNATAPTSVTYVGNNWFIAAYHMKYYDNPSGILLNGDSYTIIPSSWTRVTNTVTGAGVDAILFKVNENVPLSDLSVVSSPPANGTPVTMIGNGFDRHPDLLTYEMGVKDETYYNLKSGSANTSKRWGTNTIEGDNGDVSVGFGVTDALYTDFDYESGEAQAATYDSGGGVFVENGSSWDLAGIMLVVSNMYQIDAPTNAVMLTGGNRAYDGSETYFADLSAYHAQITNTVQIIDLDEDGIPDQWEYEKSGSSTGVDALIDGDGDGRIGEQEYIADTDPTDGASFLKWDTFSIAADQTVTFYGSTARKYQLVYTTNELTDVELAWIPAHSNEVWGVGSGTSITVTNTEPTVFYRIKVSLP